MKLTDCLDLLRLLEPRLAVYVTELPREVVAFPLARGCLYRPPVVTSGLRAITRKSPRGEHLPGDLARDLQLTPGRDATPGDQPSTPAKVRQCSSVPKECYEHMEPKVKEIPVPIIWR